MAAAMKKMVALSGVRFDDREPDLNPPQGQRAAMTARNMSFFLSLSEASPDSHVPQNRRHTRERNPRLR
jgi:hypothetical protein